MRTWVRQRTYRGMISRGDPQDLPAGMLREAVGVDCSRPGMLKKRRGLAAINRTLGSGIPRAVFDFQGPFSRFYIIWDASGVIRAWVPPEPEWADA